jgi:hypothetical protein
MGTPTMIVSFPDPASMTQPDKVMEVTDLQYRVVYTVDPTTSATTSVNVCPHTSTATIVAIPGVSAVPDAVTFKPSNDGAEGCAASVNAPTFMSSEATILSSSAAAKSADKPSQYFKTEKSSLTI